MEVSVCARLDLGWCLASRSGSRVAARALFSRDERSKSNMTRAHIYMYSYTVSKYSIYGKIDEDNRYVYIYIYR